jgi:hypothetical protein
VFQQFIRIHSMFAVFDKRPRVYRRLSSGKTFFHEA